MITHYCVTVVYLLKITFIAERIPRAEATTHKHNEEIMFNVHDKYTFLFYVNCCSRTQSHQHNIRSCKTQPTDGKNGATKNIHQIEMFMFMVAMWTRTQYSCCSCRALMPTAVDCAHIMICHFPINLLSGSVFHKNSCRQRITTTTKQKTEQKLKRSKTQLCFECCAL